MKVTAAAVEELEGANNYEQVSNLLETQSATETYLHVVDTLEEDKFSRTRRVATEGNRQLPKTPQALCAKLKALVRVRPPLAVPYIQDRLSFHSPIFRSPSCQDVSRG